MHVYRIQRCHVLHALHARQTGKLCISEILKVQIVDIFTCRLFLKYTICSFKNKIHLLDFLQFCIIATTNSRSIQRQFSSYNRLDVTK